VEGEASGEVKKYFYHTDQLGSTVAITDERGEVVWKNCYTPFGEETGYEGVEEHEGRFTGKDYDEEIGLYYFNARWYDPELGRFISLDPAKDGVNWYVYCSNRPLSYVDPSGLDNRTVAERQKLEDEFDKYAPCLQLANLKNTKEVVRRFIAITLMESTGFWDVFKGWLRSGKGKYDEVETAVIIEQVKSNLIMYGNLDKLISRYPWLSDSYAGAEVKMHFAQGMLGNNQFLEEARHMDQRLEELKNTLNFMGVAAGVRISQAEGGYVGLPENFKSGIFEVVFTISKKSTSPMCTLGNGLMYP